MRATRKPPPDDTQCPDGHDPGAGPRSATRAPAMVVVLAATVALGIGCGQSGSETARPSLTWGDEDQTTADQTTEADQTPEADQTTADQTTEVDLTAGEQTYKDFCGSCHGREFEGSTQGPSHLDAVFAPEITTDDDYRAAIGDGAPEKNYDSGPMPAIGSLDDQETANVIAYIRQVQEEEGLNG